MCHTCPLPSIQLYYAFNLISGPKALSDCVDDTDSSVSEAVRQEEEESGQTHSNSGGEKNKIAPFPDLFTY